MLHVGATKEALRGLFDNTQKHLTSLNLQRGSEDTSSGEQILCFICTLQDRKCPLSPSHIILANKRHTEQAELI